MKKYFEFPSADGKTTIKGTIWEPAGEIKAILQISHGMKEYVERYDACAEFLCEKGILVCGNDHLGHGRSVTDKSEWGYFTKKDGGRVLSKDLHTTTEMIKEMYPGKPYFLLGHSMGSFMARRYAINYSSDIDGLIVMGTGNTAGPLLVAGRMITGILGGIFGGHHKSKLVEKMAFGAYLKRIDNPLSPNAWLSRDVYEVAKYDATPECTFRFSVYGFKHMFETIQYVKDKNKIKMVRESLPILVISGAEDPVGAYGKEVKQCYDAYEKHGIKDLALMLIDEDRHEVLNELDKLDNYNRLYDWISERI